MHGDAVTDDLCSLDVHRIEILLGRGKKSAAHAKIDKAFALGQPRHTGDAFTANDQAIVHVRMAECNASCPTKLSQNFWRQRTVLRVLEAVARRPMPEVKEMALGRRGMRKLCLQLDKQFCKQVAVAVSLMSDFHFGMPFAQVSQREKLLHFLLYPHVVAAASTSTSVYLFVCLIVAVSLPLSALMATHPPGFFSAVF